MCMVFSEVFFITQLRNNRKVSINTTELLYCANINFGGIYAYLYFNISGVHKCLNSPKKINHSINISIYRVVYFILIFLFCFLIFLSCVCFLFFALCLLLWLSLTSCDFHLWNEFYLFVFETALLVRDNNCFYNCAR
jgi:hypothetical protein